VRQYSTEFKDQIVKECQEVNNISLVARRHGISKDTVGGWVRAARKRGSTAPLPRDKTQRVDELESRIESISAENDQLKKLVAEKELELAILRELRDKTNPR
jgi:transposase-like protein